MLSAPVIDHVLVPVGFERVLFPTDFSPCSDRALTHLLRIAAAYRSHVFVLHVLPRETPAISETVTDFAPRLFDINRQQGEKHMRALENSGVLAHVEHSGLLECGDLCGVLEETIQKRRIDLVLLGTHGRGGIQKLVLGSVAEEVSRRVACPVIIAGPHAPAASPESGFQRILFATEFANGSLNALRYALSMARKYHAGLTLLHVCTFMERGPFVESDAALAQERERLQAMVPENLDLAAPPAVLTRIGARTEAILATASELGADLIVLGVHSTHALTAVTHFPWTVAHQIIRQATCPVLTVRG